MSKHIVDLLILNRDEDIVGVAATKNWRDTPVEQAERITPYQFDFETLAEVPAKYVLLLTKDRSFVWKNAGRPDQEVAEFSMLPIYDRYLLEIENLETMSERAVQLVALQWLNNLTWPDPSMNSEAETILTKIGFVEDIRGGSVKLEVQLYARVR